jgi:hypothetical protein
MPKFLIKTFKQEIKFVTFDSFLPLNSNDIPYFSGLRKVRKTQTKLFFALLFKLIPARALFVAFTDRVIDTISLLKRQLCN